MKVIFLSKMGIKHGSLKVGSWSCECIRILLVYFSKFSESTFYKELFLVKTNRVKSIR